MTSLTPCRFYAQGNCRYGNNCRFYHEPRGQTGGFFGNRPLAPATFQPAGGVNQGAMQAKTNVNIDTWMETVKKDMQEWISCKIWPYSCYGPNNGKPCLPGFEDLSPEEFRLAYMQCGNNVPQEILVRFQQIQQLRINYQQPTMENRTIIERIVGSGSTLQTSTFGSTPIQKPPNIFGGTTTISPLQQQSTAGSIFGGSSGTPFGGSSTFGQPNSSSLFQSSPAQQQIPVSTPGTGIFGGSQNQPQSIFGQAGVTTPQQQPPSGFFQQPQSVFQQQTQGAPGATVNPFQNQTPTGGFFQQASINPVSSASQVQSGLFGQQQQVQQPPTTRLFQQAPNVPVTSTGILSGGQQPKPFGVPTGNIFGGAQTQEAPATTIFGGGGGIAQQGSASIFGGQPGTGVFGGLQQQSASLPLKYIYSEESDLSPSDLEAYKAADFTIDSLPLKPPPKSLCM